MTAVATKNLATRFETAGWIFFFIVFLLLAVPFIWGAFRVVYESTHPIAVVATGATAAAIVAGVITAVVNWALQRRAHRQRLSSRKKTKK